MLGKLLCADSEGDGEYCGHGNGDTSDQKNKDVVETAAVGVAETGVEDQDFRDNEDTDSDQTERTDLGENFLQMASGIIVLSDKGCCTSEESVRSGRDNNAFCLPLFAGRATVE